MTMLDIFQERKPDGMIIERVKERGGYYHLELSYNGVKQKTTLAKTCVPEQAEKNCDFTICAVMMGIGIDTGNYQMAQEWLKKQETLFTLI